MSFIRLLDSKGEKILDSVAADYEDSFTLETFGDLSESHESTEPVGTKHFIIARVQTWDPKQPEKAFYSYYNAFHLNKVLFQTQIYLGKRFIHRLRVLNPLTNSDIIGNVQYFMLKTTNSEHAKDSIKHTVVEIEKPESVSNDTLINLDTKAKDEAAKTATNIHARISSLFDAASGSNKSSSVIEVEKNEPQTWVLENHAVSEIGSESSLSTAGQVSNLVQQTANTIARSFSLSKKHPGAASAVLQSTSERKNASNGLSLKRTLSVVETKASVKKEKAPFQLSVHTKLPEAPVRVNTSKKVNVVPGVITQFAMPVAASDVPLITPKTYKGHRRSLSYRNAISATGMPLSFKDWMTIVEEDKAEVAANPALISDKYDIVKTTPTSPTTKKEAANPNLNPLIKDSAPISSNSETPANIYNAVLFATDNDFLESSKIRAIFKENAVNPDDAKLFEMPEFTGAEDSPPPVELDDEVDVCIVCIEGPSDATSPGTVERFQRFKKFAVIFAALVMITVFVVICILLSQTKKP